MEELITKISSRCKLSEEDENLLRQTIRKLHYPKGSVVIAEGHIDDSIYFLQKGVWRAFIGSEEKEQTLWFAIPGETVFSSWGYLKGAPSRFTISASSDSIAVELKKTTVKSLSMSSYLFSEFLQELYVDILVATDDSLVDISCPGAENRYRAFVKKMPEIFKTVPLKEIAAYIGVTQQSLSRIRAGLKDK